jgi:hypothetical protein
VGFRFQRRVKILPTEYIKSILISIVASSLLAGIAFAQTPRSGVTGLGSMVPLGQTHFVTNNGLASNASARDRFQQTWDHVTVHVSANVNVSPTLLKDGQAATTAIFARIRIHLTWADQRSHVSKNVSASTLQPATPDIAVEIVPHAPHTVNGVALAMAMPFTDSGVRIVIFYDRVDPLLQGHHAPGATILAYILAHEIGHVLEGVARHSETGIMRARWTDNDLRQMGIGVLSFTTEDVQLIRRHLLTVDASTAPGLTAGL